MDLEATKETISIIEIYYSDIENLLSGLDVGRWSCCSLVGGVLDCLERTHNFEFQLRHLEPNERWESNSLNNFPSK